MVDKRVAAVIDGQPVESRGSEEWFACDWPACNDLIVGQPLSDRLGSRLVQVEQITHGGLIIHRHMQIAACDAHVRVPCRITNLGQPAKAWIMNVCRP